MEKKSIIWGQILEDQLANYSFNNSPFEHFRDLLVYDPLALSVLTGVILFVYPMVRFAWFFCYIDLRVRGDFWDLELRFQKETERLQESRA